MEELLAARGIIVSHETVRQWARKFGQQFANRSVVGSRGLATNGIWMRSCSRLPV
jgi:putative transposase